MRGFWLKNSGSLFLIVWGIILAPLLGIKMNQLVYWIVLLLIGGADILGYVNGIKENLNGERLKIFKGSQMTSQKKGEKNGSKNPGCGSGCSEEN